jgi:hypothetical protein
MNAIIEFLINSYTQALFWALVVAFSIYFALKSKKLSFGKDTGMRAWALIAVGLLLIGLRVSFKVLFHNYDSSYTLQILRYTTGIIGIIILFLGFVMYWFSLKRIYGASD